jgi:hypothetical protein
MALMAITVLAKGPQITLENVNKSVLERLTNNLKEGKMF